MESNRKTLVQNTTMLYILNITKLFLPLITLPYLTRILSTDCYGSVVFIKSLINYMQIIIEFGFMLSATKDIVNCNGDKEKINRVVSSTLLAKLMLAGCAFVILIVALITVDKTEYMTTYGLLSFVSVVLMIFLCDFFFKGIEKMQTITLRFLIMRSISTVFTFVLIKGDADILWIPVLDIIGVSAAVLFVFRELKKEDIRLVKVPVAEAWLRIKSSFVFFLSTLSTTAFGILNTFLIGVYLTETDTAYWGLVLQLVAAIQAMYSPITDASYPRMLKTKSAATIKRILMIYMPIIVAGCLIIIFAGEPIILIIAGKKYADAVYLLKYLVPVLFFSFPAMLLGWPVLGSIGKASQVTVTTVISAITQVTGLIVLALLNRFTLFDIVIVRNITEFVLFLTRLILCIINRDKFNKKTV